MFYIRVSPVYSSVVFLGNARFLWAGGRVGERKNAEEDITWKYVQDKIIKPLCSMNF